jgi:glycosyltransferase involved in cell wall biosynthesis
VLGRSCLGYFRADITPVPLAPLLIALPHALSVGGITTWALRLANTLAARSRPVALLLHQEPPGSAAIDAPIHPAVRIFRLPPVPAFGDRPGDLSPYLTHYRAAVQSLASDHAQPVVVSPNMHGDCYGVLAAIAQSDPAIIRVLGWQHSDIEYDARVLTRYEPLISSFIAVSDRIESTLRSRLPGRTADIQNIPYGVEVSAQPPARHRQAGDPLRLIYTGRLEHHQKRILALIHLTDNLTRRGLSHQLTVVGDGPAAPQFNDLAATRPTFTRLPVVSPAQIRALLAVSDAFVLPSRYEGLSVSMLEAMAAGCVPVLARTDSGSLQAINPGVNGEIADVAPEADERATGLAMADAVARLTPRTLPDISRATWATARDRYSLDLHADRVATLIDAAASAPPRPWPASLPPAFTAPAGSAHGSGSVPPDGPARLAALLNSLAGRRILLHGSGQHTLQLAPTLAASPAIIVGITDDDRQRAGQRVLDYPIISPDHAPATGATDVIISSWMHQDAIYARRKLYEDQGLRVHRIYA